MPTRVEILEHNILYNFDSLQVAACGKRQFPVLKSNAYGHGIETIAKILAKKDPPYFAVYRYSEALEIQKLTDIPTLILGTPDIEQAARDESPKTVFSADSLNVLKNLENLNKPLKIHLCLNTGMNREGINAANLGESINIIKNSKYLKCEGVWSHFADSDGETDQFVKVQEKNFSAMLNEFEGNGLRFRWTHIGDSAGFLKTTDERINSFRAGIAGYGISPVAILPALRPALRLITTVTNILDLKKGDFVGYNCTYQAPEDMRAGIVQVGYFEGLNRKLSNSGFFGYPANGNDSSFLPIIGRISMNQSCFALSNLPVDILDEIIIISAEPSHKNSVSNIAKLSGTIPEEILIHINQSIPRIII